MKNTILASLFLLTGALGTIAVGMVTAPINRIGILAYANSNGEELQAITDQVYSDFPIARRVAITIYTSDVHGLGQVYSTVVADSYDHEKGITGLIPEYTEILLDTGNNYFLNFTKGKCSALTIDDLLIAEQENIDNAVEAVSCPIITDVLIGEFIIAFDVNHPREHPPEYYYPRLEQAAIQVAALLRNYE